MRIGIALVFTAFAALGGAMSLGLSAFVGTMFPIRIFLIVIALVLSLRALIWHIAGRKRFAFDRYPVQAHRTVAGSGWRGTAYFGWILGTSMYTQMTTPLVQALAGLAAVLGVPFGIGAGIGLGLARSFAPWRGALTQGRSNPAAVVDRYIVRRGSGPFFRFVGAVAALWVTSAGILALGRWL